MLSMYIFVHLLVQVDASIVRDDPTGKDLGQTHHQMKMASKASERVSEATMGIFENSTAELGGETLKTADQHGSIKLGLGVVVPEGESIGTRQHLISKHTFEFLRTGTREEVMAGKAHKTLSKVIQTAMMRRNNQKLQVGGLTKPDLERVEAEEKKPLTYDYGAGNCQVSKCQACQKIGFFCASEFFGASGVQVACKCKANPSKSWKNLWTPSKDCDPHTFTDSQKQIKRKAIGGCGSFMLLEFQGKYS